jgi:Alternative complex III, ActD subunit
VSTVVIAEFSEADALLAAARAHHASGDRLLDTFSPFPIEGMAELLGATSTRLRLVMAIGGLSVAALMFGTEWFSAVIDYPINSGGRPLNSWLAFMLPPFAVGILAAAIFGFIALMWETGLPRLNHPLFAIEDFERASQNRFVLALLGPENEKGLSSMRQRLKRAGALAIREVTT